MPSKQETEHIKLCYYHIFCFLGIGAIVCTHIPIQSTGGPIIKMFRDYTLI